MQTGKQLFIMRNEAVRSRALAAVRDAPLEMVVKIQPPTRSLEQSARMWAMLGDVARQVEWYGKKLSPDDWKAVFTSALKKHEVAPGIDGGFVVLGTSTSAMTRREMSDLIELMMAFGAEHGVIWGREE